MIDAVQQALARLDRWVERNGWAGYDPYDLKGERLYRAIMHSKTTLAKPVKPILYYGEIVAPLLMRRLLHVKKQINPKGMGLFARGYIELYRITGEEPFLRKARELLNWLAVHSDKNHTGSGWGYPFDWRRPKGVTPKHLPLSVVTVICGHAFADYYETTGSFDHLDIAAQVCEFLRQHLKIQEFSDGSICFSYGPSDDYQVINSNLYVASLLGRVGGLMKQAEYMALARRAALFSLNQQHADGSWYYWAYDYWHGPSQIDNYHTGINLQWLMELIRYEKESDQIDRYQKAFNRGLLFYKQHLFLEDGTPKFYHNAVNPLDIHSCAQAILTLSMAPKFVNDQALRQQVEMLRDKVISWTLTHMVNRSGSFRYRMYRFRRLPLSWSMNIPYIRWGQAWMLYALAKYIRCRSAGAQVEESTHREAIADTGSSKRFLI